MSLSITLSEEDPHSGGIWCASGMPFYTLFQKLLLEVDLTENGNFIINDKKKLQELIETIEIELRKLMNEKSTSSKRKHNFVFEGKFYHLNVRLPEDALINNVLITKNLTLLALKTGNGIMINID